MYIRTDKFWSILDQPKSLRCLFPASKMPKITFETISLSAYTMTYITIYIHEFHICSLQICVVLIPARGPMAFFLTAPG